MGGTSGYPQPFYSKHKVVELTCPHCEHMLTFLVNERGQSIYSCKCGRWFKAVDGQISNHEYPKSKWRYEQNEEYKDA